jgi:hypothetical protein
MSNYTTQTAALKAVTIDTAKLDAKRIDTKKLFINGELFDPSQTGSSQIKESPNQALFIMLVQGTGFSLQSLKSDEDGNSIFGTEGSFYTVSETQGELPSGVYALIQLDENFIKCLCNNVMDDSSASLLYIIPSAKFMLLNQNGDKLEQCIFENFITVGGSSMYWFIKICEVDDNLSELYGGITTGGLLPGLAFVITIPYYITENDTSSSTYSLRKTNPFDSLREKIEQMGQQILDNSAE